MKKYWNIRFTERSFVVTENIGYMSKDSFKNILLDNDAKLDNGNFHLILVWVLLHRQKSNDGDCNSFKQNDSHIKKIENYMKENYNEVALNHLKKSDNQRTNIRNV